MPSVDGFLTIRNIDFSEFLAFEDAFNHISSSSKEEMNAILIYNSAVSELSFVIQESASWAYTKITGKMSFTVPDEGPTVPTSQEFIFGTGISSNLLFYTLGNYSVEEKKEVVFSIQFGEQGGSFLIEKGKDRVSLPCKFLRRSKIEEVALTILEAEVPEETPIFQLASFGERKNDFLNGIVTSSKFLSKDEKKNNAYAIYPDKIVVNDKRHIFVYKYDQELEVESEAGFPVSLHKSCAKILMLFHAKKMLFDMVLFDKSRVYFTSGAFVAVLNNSMAHIAPPPASALVKLIPDVHVTSVTAGDLLANSNFFLGFYRGNAEFRPITFEVKDEGIRMLLRDSGVTGSASCNVEKMLECPVFDGALESNKDQVSILNDSLISFVKDLDPKDTIDLLFQDGKKEHPAVYLRHTKRKVYLAKLD